MAGKKQIGSARTGAPARKRRTVSRTTGNAPGGTQPTTQEQEHRSKTVGSFNVDINRSDRTSSVSHGEAVVGADRWDGEHIRQGMRLKGDVAVWIEEASHHLAMALCHYSNHIGKPCSDCLRWSQQELAFAITMKGTVTEDERLRALGVSVASSARMADMAVGSGVQARTKGGRDAKRKGTKQSRTKKN